LVRFSLKNDGFPIETFIKKDVIWWKILETGIAKDESVINIAKNV